MKGKGYHADCYSLQKFIAGLKEDNELCCVRRPVSPDLELACITVEVSRSGGPALLFEDVGSKIPVLANAFGSMRRISRALGLDRIEDAVPRIESILKRGEVCLHHTETYGKLPILSQAPCHEIVLDEDDVDLSLLPVPRCWPGDAGPAITLPVVFTASPSDLMPNAGLYRMQVVGKNSTLMHWYPGSGGAVHYSQAMRMGKPLPVAVAIGPEPAVTLSACAPLPERLYEIDFATHLTGQPIEMVRCIRSDLLVPASSQIVLEGECLPGETGVEGPFGTHTGYYSESGPFPRFHVRCMTMRRDAILPVTVPGPPPQEDCFMAKALERLFLPLLRHKIPDITDLNFPLEGIFARLVFVAIRKRYPGHAADVMFRLWQMDRGVFSRIIWVFDHDVDIHNLSEVLWSMANRTNFHRDIILAPGPTDSLDPHAAFCNGACRMGLDCTDKWPEERDGVPPPEKLSMPQEVMERCRDVVSEILSTPRLVNDEKRTE